MTGSLRQLRPHQIAGIEGIKASILAGQTRPILAAPTGYGKTEVAAHLIADARERNRRIVFCVPTIGLVDQTFERFVANGFDPSDMGVIQASHPWRRPHAPIQIATGQTLAKRERPMVDEVIIDEAHQLQQTYRDWITDPEWSQVPFIGMTATPGTKGLGKYFTNLVKPIALTDLIEQRYLVPMQVFAPSKPNLEGLRTVGDDYNQGDLAERMNKPHLVADVVKTWLARGEMRPTLCFATGKLHAKALYDQFASEGVPSAYVDADTPREERERIGKAMVTREVLVAVNIGTLTTGIDWDVRCIILARPTKSQMLFVQMIGRGLRTAEAKADCIVLDHSDTHERLGMVTDISFDLCDGKPKPKADAKKRDDATLMPKCCKSCTALMPAHEPKCLACGEPMRLPPVFTVDGELTLYGQNHIADGLVKELRGLGITMRVADDKLLVKAPNNYVPDVFREQIRAHRDDLYRMHAPKQPKAESVKGELANQPKQVIFSMLLTYADERGYKEGWAANKYREIYDVFPRGLAKHGEMSPSPMLKSWIKSQAIRWSKSSKNGVNHAAA